MSAAGAPRLSILDQTPAVSGHTLADAVAATVELAQAADDLGYTRFWCAEHHGIEAVADPCPEVMIARIGSVTKRIRIGSGGIMLPYYSPFKVAEQFLMLEAMFPNRIDLGVGRAPGGDLKTARAVAGAGRFDSDQFPARVIDLITLFSGDLPHDHYAHGVTLQPATTTRPQMWILGSSDFGAALAAQLGLRFAFAHFINQQYGDLVTRMYRERFQPGQEASAYSAVAVFAICADTPAEAEDLGATVALRSVHMAYGRNGPIPTVAEARAHRFNEMEQQLIESERGRRIVGTPEQIAEKLLDFQQKFQADEIIVISIAGNYAARLRSYELLAKHFNLGAAAETDREHA